MGAIIMSVLVSVIAIVGVIYFNHQDKKGKLPILGYPLLDGRQSAPV